MCVLLDRDILSASMDIMYSVEVVRRVLLADRRNFPFSTSTAAELSWHVIQHTHWPQKKKLPKRLYSRFSIYNNSGINFDGKRLKLIDDTSDDDHIKHDHSTKEDSGNQLEKGIQSQKYNIKNRKKMSSYYLDCSLNHCGRVAIFGY